MTSFFARPLTLGAPQPQQDTDWTIYQDDHLLIVNKPAGLLAVPGRGADKQDCLIHRVQAVFPQALVVHRLDQATSGLVVLALSPVVQKSLSALFQDRHIHKRYIATVQGQLQPEMGTVTLPLMADWPQRPRQKVDMVMGKPSETQWQVQTYDAASDTTLVALHPVTGRTHQLRVHMLALGHPIVGDTLYGTASSAPRMALHAQSLAFTHPITGKWLAVCCEPGPVHDAAPASAPERATAQQEQPGQ